MRLTEPPATLIDAMEEIPSGTPETFLAYLQRDINCLGEDIQSVRLQSLQKLEGVLVRRIDKLSTDVIDAVADALLKPLLKRLKDKSEKCREVSIKVLRSLVENASDLSAMLPYVFPTLVARLGCEDLDGIAHLPEVARPDPEQKPTEIARPVEESEEVRKALAHFVASLLARCNQTQIYSYVDEATGVLRAQAMDPFHEVKALACETMIAFCHNHTEMLLHFTEPLGRSLTSCLTHNHAKLRIAGLRALIAVLHCGTWKHNFEVFQILMAWQDPNKVPVKAFYEGMTNVNYMSMLSFDRHPAVRRFWFETLAHMLLDLVDKVDLEPYIFPYLLTGLCDDNEEIALEVFWLIEKCGELYEQEHESDLRKERQYGFDYGWTYQGRAHCPFPLQAIWAGGGRYRFTQRSAAHGPDLMGEKELSQHRLRDKDIDTPQGEQCEDHVDEDILALPERDYEWPELRDLEVRTSMPRPRLGSRCWVRTHTRRYIKATFNDVVDFRDCTTLNAGRLLCMSLAYTEEGITEWLQPMMAALCKFYSGRAWAAGDTQAARTYDCVCKLAGAFLDPASYWTQLKDALDPDCSLDLAQRVASIKILALCIEGSVDTLLSIQDPDPALGMGRLEPVIPDLISALHASDLLLEPADESRAALWALIFAFVEPLCRHLSTSQVSQLLFIALALAAEIPPETSCELASTTFDEAPLLEDERIKDSEKLHRLLSMLSACVDSEDAPSADFSLDSLDDDDAPAVEANADPRMAHKTLFQQAFAEVMARLEDSFQVFRSVMYLTPLVVITSTEHSSTVLERLAAFCSPASSPPVRKASQALGAHLVLRCATLLSGASEAATSRGACTFMSKAFQLLAKSQIEGIASTKVLSYMVIVSSLSLWRQLFLCPLIDLRLVLFPCDEAGPSKPVQWLLALIADQELYKKFYAALEHAETSVTGQCREDFVVKKAKQIRDESEYRSNAVRTFAASTLLLALRRLLLDGQSIPWVEGSGPGSIRALFCGVASLFRIAKPTLEPPFVKATPAHMIIYAAEILHLLMHQGVQTATLPFRLVDDAARVIHQLPVPGMLQGLPFGLEVEEREAMAADFISTLIGLNLTLPPDPQAKYAPATLDDSSKDILLGWDDALPSQGASAGLSANAPSARGGAIPPEVARILAQSSECLRWNAALAMYILGVDLSVVCRDGFQRSLVRFRQRKEQGRILVTIDLLERARRVVDAAA